MHALAEVTVASGPGWTATIGPHRIELHVETRKDFLPVAVEALLSPAIQRFWTVEPIDMIDALGREVYLLVRQ